MNFLKKLSEKTNEQLKSTISTVEDYIKVPSEVREERLNICLDCEELFKPTKTCKVCGCFMELKTWLPSQKCPIDKWSEHVIATDKQP